LYINPGISVTEYIKLLKNKGFGLRPLIENLSPNLIVMQPIFSFPFSHYNTTSKVLSNRIISRSINKYLKNFGIYPDILWLSFPFQNDLIGRFSEKIVCYDCMDDYLHMIPKSSEKLDIAEKDILIKANIVFASSSKLFDKCLKYNKETYLVPNGAEVNHFIKARDCTLEIPEDFVHLRSPIMGFFGYIGDWIDLELLAFLAESNPNWSFVIIGPINTDTNIIKKYANIFLLGEVPYKNLPNYLQKFDVCMILFKVNSLTESVNPVKLFEYLASGKPIVSTNLPEIRKYERYCMISSNKEEFLHNLRVCLEKKDKNDTIERIQFARENSWEDRVTIIEILLNDFFSSGGIKDKS
jgi:glycosyltransferase involved in cell wall biosynthesis